MEVANKPHVVCIRFPCQSHIKAMLQFAKLLHFKGFHITFVNTVFNHNRFLKSLGSPNFLDGLPDFKFEAIPDGLPPSNEDATQDIASLSVSMTNNVLSPFLDLVTTKLASDINIPQVTAIVSDVFVNCFTITAAEELGIPVVQFTSVSACGLMGYMQFSALVEKGLAPLKDEATLDMIIDWIPSMKGIRLKDLPSVFRTSNPSDLIMFKYCMEAAQGAKKASAVIIHTFHKLERDVLDALSSNILPQVFSIGPLQLYLNHIPEDPSTQARYSLWKEDTDCLKWLDTKPPNSVVYVNFGSITVMTPQQLVEFGMGLANSKHFFFWVIRPDLVVGESAVLPPEFFSQTKERGLITSWCPQEQVLNHSSVGGFLTHCGWSSIIETISAGVPTLCWPFFADQQTNCSYACNELGLGMEIDHDVTRDEVEKLVRELMEGDKGKKMRIKAIEWKKLAEEATAPHGSSAINLDTLVNQLVLLKKEKKKQY